jgi:hypothetical protein
MSWTLLRLAWSRTADEELAEVGERGIRVQQPDADLLATGERARGQARGVVQRLDRGLDALAGFRPDIGLAVEARG